MCIRDRYHATRISSSPRDWMNYLDTAARLYRYPFMDQLLIHAQRPKATACASLELWNEKMLRWVNRGAKGIALLDETIDVYKRQGVQFDVFYGGHASASAHGHQTWEAYIADSNGSQEVEVTTTRAVSYTHLTQRYKEPYLF